MCELLVEVRFIRQHQHGKGRKIHLGIDDAEEIAAFAEQAQRALIAAFCLRNVVLHIIFFAQGVRFGDCKQIMLSISCAECFQ